MLRPFALLTALSFLSYANPGHAQALASPAETADQQPVSYVSNGERVGNELLATGLGTLALGGVVGGGLLAMKENCHGTNPLCVLGGVALIGGGGAGFLFGIPAITDWAGDDRGSYWAAVGGGAAGYVLGAVAASGVIELGDENDLGTIIPAVGAFWLVHTASVVFFYELTVDRSLRYEEAPEPDGITLSATPVLGSDYQGLALSGTY